MPDLLPLEEGFLARWLPILSLPEKITGARKKEAEGGLVATGLPDSAVFEQARRALIWHEADGLSTEETLACLEPLASLATSATPLAWSRKILDAQSWRRCSCIGCTAYGPAVAYQRHQGGHVARTVHNMHALCLTADLAYDLAHQGDHPYQRQGQEALF